MDRRRSALLLLLLFIVCTVTAIVLSGTRSGPGQGVAPTIVQGLGYLFALGGGGLLVIPDRRAAHREHAGHDRPMDAGATPPGSQRPAGLVILAALAVLVAVDLVGANSGGGADIGLGLIRLVGLVTIVAVAVGLAPGAFSRARS